MGDPVAKLAGKGAGVFKEDMAGRPLPLRIGRRKMLADIAAPQRAIDRVCDGVHPHIGIRMADERMGMRHLYAAQPDVIAGSEFVHVETVAGADIHLALQKLFGPGEIFGRGDLEVALVAARGGHRQARRSGDGHIVGRLGIRGGAVRGEDRGVMKPLGRLGAKEAGAILNTAHLATFALPERVRHRKGRGGGWVGGKGADHIADHGVADKRPGGIVDQHEVGGLAFQRFKPRADGRGAGGASGNGTAACESFSPLHLIGRKNDNNRTDPREGRDRPVNDPLAAQHLPLFRLGPARPEAASGGDYDHGCRHGAPCSARFYVRVIACANGHFDQPFLHKK